MVNKLKHKFSKLITDKKFSEILTGSTWALAAQVVATGLGLVSSIFIARLYGTEVMGIVALLTSFLTLTTIFTLLGTNTSILRLIAEHQLKYSPSSARRVYRKTQILVIGMSLFAGILLFLSSDFIADKVFSKPHLSFYLTLATFFIVFRSLMLLNTQAIRGLRLVRMFAFMLILPQTLNLILLILLRIILTSRDVPIYALLASFAVTGVTGWAIMEFCFTKRMRQQDHIREMPTRQILSLSLPMLFTAAMTIVISQSGVIMLGMFSTESQVGYYAIAVKLATSITFVLSAINSMAGPKFAELFQVGKLDELFYVAKKSAKLIFWATMPMLFALIVFGKQVISIAYGYQFILAYPALVILSLGQFVNSISGSTGLFMNMTDNHKILRNIMMTAALTNIGMNLVLIPKFGICGAALTAMASICLWNFAALAYIKLNFGRTPGYFPRLGRV